MTDLLWQFDRDEPPISWNCAELEAVNLLFQLELDPRLAPADFAAAFRDNMRSYVDAYGRLRRYDREILESILTPWRMMLAELTAELYQPQPPEGMTPSTSA